MADQVDWVSGRTRVLGIVGHPIEQVRSPEMFSAELARRGHDALMVPLHVLPEAFDAALRGLMAVGNLDGLVFTIPYKQAACALAGELGAQARAVGAINALVRREGQWVGDMFDGAGCVEAFRRRGLSFAGRHVTLIGAGGAGSAIGAAVAHERPAAMRLFDPDMARAEALAAVVRRVDRSIQVEIATPDAHGTDVLLNASPVGMLGDPNTPVPLDQPLPPRLVVFDAIVKPEQTQLLQAAEDSGCTVVRGREMMRGQISRMVDFFGFPEQERIP